jgi:exodeoxyribonuclease-3
MRIITFNANGIRAATRKGFFDWFAGQDADILCVQELKAQAHQIPDEAKPAGFFAYFHCAEKPGYSGVGLYSRREPDRVVEGLNAIDDTCDWSDIDAEGRYLQADFGELSVISCYFPSGSSSEARQAVKMSFLERFLPWIKRQKEAGRRIILCGDINIAHNEIDLKNWRGNRKNSGFLPEERAWMDELMAAGFIDIFRNLYPEDARYSWWSNRGRARENDVGWRIDYHICCPETAARAARVSIYRENFFSDHAPVTANFDLDL